MRACFASGWLAFLAFPLLAAEPNLGLKVPPGFAVQEFSKPDLANDIYTMHIDAKGRIVVAGRGYVKQLLASQPGGAADRARAILPAPKDGPTGLLWEGETFYLTSEGGLRQYRGVTGDKIPAGPGELLLKLKTGGEHDAHAVRRGSDGSLYILCGNNAEIGKLNFAVSSPIRKPIAGGLLKLSADGKTLECLADGFRNPYDFDFHTTGDPFTFDSDNERCLGLPWYEFTRFYHIRPGGNYGWLNPQFAQTWRKPPYFPDVVAPVCTVGRGSPTGVACYRHSHFPEKYRGGFFIADWTFGKIWFVPLTTKGDTFAGKPEVFLEATGENGFAPTGLAVHPLTGELFVSIGGRGTRGGVYRVSYSQRAGQGETIPIQPRPAVRVPAVTANRVPQVYRTLTDVRQLQLVLGDLVDPKAQGTAREGYSVRQPVDETQAAKFTPSLRDAFPSGQPDLDRELSRTLAALKDTSPDAVRKIVAVWKQELPPAEDVHYLIVLSQLAAPRTDAERQTVAQVLVGLDAKYEKQKLIRDRHWPLRLSETTAELIRKDPQLAKVLVDHPDFGNPAHGWLAQVPGIDPVAAARKVLVKASADPKYEWKPGLLQRLGALPDAEVHGLLNKLAQQGGLEQAAIPLLARAPQEADRAIFLTGLRRGTGAIVEQCALALARLPAPKTDDEWIAAIRGLRRFNDEKTELAIRKALAILLKSRTGQELPATFVAWETWVKANKPEALKQLAAADGYDPEAWKPRLAQVPWDQGNAENGKALYAKASCASCHSGGNAVGPSLEGVSKRFSRDDLMLAILDPSRDIPVRYRTTKILTVDEKAYEGVIIYEAIDGLLLQTGADDTVRIAGEAIDVKRPGTLSLMPTGLLDKFSPGEIADLLAYLKQLGEKK